MQILSVMMEELKKDGLCDFILKTVGEKTEGREEWRGKEGTEKCVHHSHGEQGFVFLVFSETMKSPGIPLSLVHRQWTCVWDFSGSFCSQCARWDRA